MNTAEYLNTLIECKEDMKAAIIEQGVTPTGGLSTYADAIYDLYSDILFSGLNWDEETRLAAIDSLQTYIEWTSRKVEEFIQNEIDSGRNGEECFNFDDLNNSGNYWGNMYGLTFFPSTDITSNLTSMKRFFQYQNGLLAVGRFNTSNVTDMSSMFFNCANLISIPQMDTSKVTNMGSMFAGCENITSIPQMDTSKVTNMGSMFAGCENITSIPQMDTSKVTNMGSMFAGCENITSIPQMDTSKVTNMGSMFAGCENITSIPQMDTSKVTNMGSMFAGCENITSIPQLDTSKVTDMGSMFSGCYNLTSIPQLDTSKVTDMRYMFNNCSGLTSIPLLDASNVSDISYMFKDYYSNKDINITTLMGFKNLGKVEKLVGANTCLDGCSKLTRDSILNVINNLYDRASAGYREMLVIFIPNAFMLLTQEEIAIATNKGWIIYGA